ncbi:MAG TPA: Asp-tRNA(Asn)/Glu-tRNA(Gln) amidotransferase subunit GatC [Candidatus Saccharimonadales bacterium]|nr:Asp-tRNA(Asn)/Glu-tRNA(Gln) amidotransferase subunit GatC [Candidatus Saccharimonadales bacterium]
MQLTKEEITHIAELSRLDLSPAEIEKYRSQLGSILDYVAMLDEVQTNGVPPTAQVSGLMDVFREDVVKPWNQEEVEAALSQSERENGNVKVKRVLQ